MKAATHCCFCGTRWPRGDPYPRTCICGETTWSNPVPVGVLLVPILESPGRVLGVRRAIPPFIGSLALPGGFLEDGETWQEGSLRELREETGGLVIQSQISLLDVVSTSPVPNRILIFSITEGTDRVPENFTPNDEVSELVSIGLEDALCFPIHQSQKDRFLRGPLRA